MQFFTAGEDIAITVPFARDGEPFVPDATGLGWYLRDQTGAKGATTPLAQTTESDIEITIAAASNVTPAGQRFSKAFLCVFGTNNGASFTIVTPYTLNPWINTTIVPDDIRSYFGVSVGELADTDIDIADAYFEFVDSVGSQALVDAALSSGTVNETQANTAILMKAACAVIPGMQLRLSQSETDGSLGVTRMPNIDIDFAALYKLASLIYADAVNAISNRIVVQWTGFVVAPVLDRVTGGRRAVLRPW